LIVFSPPAKAFKPSRVLFVHRYSAPRSFTASSKSVKSH
jgi:hypothetical protein